MTLSLTLALAPSQVTDFAKYPLWTTGLKEIVDQAFVLLSGGKIAGASSTSGSNLQKPKGQ